MQTAQSPNAFDYTSAVAISLGGFFVVLAFVLLSRYRQISQQITSSSDLGHDLWEALETRLKKQDERILDMMGRLDAVQSRWVAPLPPMAAATSKATAEAQRSPARPEPLRTGSGAPGKRSLERSVIQLLSEKPRTSVEITALIGKSREHTARTLKALFERGLVTRDDSEKPFVYQLTEEGRRYLSQS
ncbi:MAG: hypothetical protein LYZ66_05595 [Nitrososphaerales archaeon]|nr:hypothetical protein [Nitrososphaerales archaeon]